MLDITTLQRGDVLLQAAVAEATLGEMPTARGRIDALLAFDDDTLFTLTKIAVTYLTRIYRAEGQEWTAPQNAGDADQAHPTAGRRYTFGLLDAWSTRQGGTVKKLFSAAAADPRLREELLRDPFDFALDKALELAAKHVGPHTLARQLCKSIGREDRSISEDWPN
ncbi:hypothetical protein QMK19_26595 [Streptomyces sp. H10-C2]|uniref:hypothetical protein n=1 Tax=unclassified Streptomyces TaxID=2593676 RepID=UPI0024B9679F|nr:MULTISPECIES: hypothetical protein [unclassified Streptomyces]MDJ0343620.1 hypothetical protein [Streptomyces sp. PH10-H1]MDJ0373132.1 hypothetical protein [Streptomyces sp. H10-C2]